LGRKLLTADVPHALYTLYNDLSSNHWAFADIVEVSVEHDYSWKDSGYENWTHWQRPALAPPPAVAAVNVPPAAEPEMSVPMQTASTPPPVAATTTPEGEYIFYTVVLGDTLWNVAERFGTTVAAIQAANHLTTDVIQLGTEIKIPHGSAALETASAPPAVAAPTVAATPEGEYILYTVALGDTLWNVAERFGTSVAAIQAVNNLTSDVIQLGSEIKIPR
jgi:LysM repeat protein